MRNDILVSWKIRRMSTKALSSQISVSDMMSLLDTEMQKIIDSMQTIATDLAENLKKTLPITVP